MFQCLETFIVKMLESDDKWTNVYLALDHYNKGQEQLINKQKYDHWGFVNFFLRYPKNFFILIERSVERNTRYSRYSF